MIHDFLSCKLASAITFSITYSFTDIVKEMPEPFPLPAEVIIAKAAAGWAHCVSVTGIYKNEYSVFNSGSRCGTT